MSKYLIDTLQQIIDDPNQTILWKVLFQEAENCSQVEIKQALCNKLHHMHFNQTNAELLRLNFLHELTSNAIYQQSIAHVLLKNTIRSPDRLMHFITYTWALAVYTQANTEDFLTTLRLAQLPAIISKLTKHVIAQSPEFSPKEYPFAIKKVAIIAPYLANEIHTPSSTVINQCKLLCAAEKVVHVFSAQEAEISLPERFNPNNKHVRFSPPDIDFWRQKLPRGAQLTLSDSRFSLQRRWQEMMQHIAEFDPDVVYLCGLYSPLAAALYTRRPVLALNVHAMPSISPADVWLSADEHAPASSPWEPVYPLPVTRFHPYRVKRQPVVKVLSRLDLGLDRDALVWITVGFRLADEITGEWAERCVQLIRQQPQIVWLLVGVDTVPPALQHLPADNIRVLGGRKDVSAVLQLADIYVNPPRMGGGYSVAEAMAESLPVVSLADSDGGRKLGANAARDETAYFHLLSALCADVNLRKQQGTVLQQRFASQLDLAAAGPDLCAALDQAASIASQRLQIKN